VRTFLGRHRRAAVTLLLAVCAIAALLFFRAPSVTMQLAARSEVMTLRLAGPLHLNRLQISELEISGLRQIELPGALGSESVEPSEKFYLQPARSDDGAGKPTPDTGIDVYLTEGQLVTVQENLQEGRGHYIVQTSGGSPTSGRLLTFIQRGQILGRGPKATPFRTEAGQSVQFLGGPDGLRVNLTVVQPRAGHIAPTEISSLDFQDSLGAAATELGNVSGLIGAELSFLEVPDRTVTLHQGGTLRLRRLRGTLQALELGDSGVSANVSGEIRGATLEVSRGHRELLPSLFEYLQHAPGVRIAIGVFSLVLGIYSFLDHHKKREGAS
jgi:hypothetical protein